jgi:hypothetical protein
MMEWFRAGGWGMFVILAIGAAAIGYGVGAVRRPTGERIAALRGLIGMILTSALFAFGTNMWAVNRHLSDEAFVKARAITAADLPFVALMGVTEAAQALTLGGLLALAVAALRVLAERRRGREAQA